MMGADVKYLGNGDAVLVLGEGPDRETSLDGGRTAHAVPQLTFVRLGTIEHGEADGLFDERPAYDEQTATWTPPGSPSPQDQAEAAADDEANEYVDNGDGTYTRERDGARGTFGPNGFTETAADSGTPATIATAPATPATTGQPSPTGTPAAENTGTGTAPPAQGTE